MKEQHIVCNGALCKCQFGTTPDAIKVKQTDYYVNDPAGARKTIANTMDIGQPFNANTFGTCKKMNNNPCKPVITEWNNYFDKVSLQNGGKVLLEESKAICSVAGNPCVEIIFHGQVAAPSAKQLSKTAGCVQAALNPLLDLKQTLQQEEKIPLPLK